MILLNYRKRRCFSLVFTPRACLIQSRVWGLFAVPPRSRCGRYGNEKKWRGFSSVISPILCWLLTTFQACTFDQCPPSIAFRRPARPRSAFDHQSTIRRPWICRMLGVHAEDHHHLIGLTEQMKKGSCSANNCRFLTSYYMKTLFKNYNRRLMIRREVHGHPLV